MRESHVKHLVCCRCGSDLTFKNDAQLIRKNNVIETGVLICRNCSREYKITDCIPRFVDSESYTRGFGFQWTKHAKIQYDSYNGLTLTKDRFFNSTRFSPNLNGELILEAGYRFGLLYEKKRLFVKRNSDGTLCALITNKKYFLIASAVEYYRKLL